MLRLVLALVLGTGPALAHEFWIDPVDYAVAPDAPLQADIRVGEALQGSRYSYNPRNFDRFELVMGDSVLAVEGRAGDRPALNMPAPEEGLAVVVHVTRDYTLTYDGWERFENFTNHKDFAWAQEEHRARGLPEKGFKELYSRHAKSLMAVGDGAGSDREMGLETEIVALTNPYTEDLDEGFRVRVLYNGAPRADVQVELMSRGPDDSLGLSFHRTDAAGEVALPVEPGHRYLADHVVLRALEPEAEGDPVWESLWASITFAVPE